MKNKPVQAEVVVIEESPKIAVKRIILSKTIWVNLLAFIAFWVQKEYGFLINEDLQMQALTLINICLRFLTKEAIVWGGDDGNSTKDS
nr:MAG: hypothetical protein [Caudoviricetes sp.]